MNGRRKTLTLRLGATTPAEREADVTSLLERVIGHHLCVRWSYDGTTMLVAPQVLYRRGRHLHVDAVVIERSGAPLTEPRLDDFRLAGLSHIVLTTESFAPDATVDPTNVRYRDGIVARVSL